MYKLLVKPFATILSIKPIPTFKLITFPQSASVFKFGSNKDSNTKYGNMDQNKPENQVQREKQEHESKSSKVSNDKILQKDEKDSHIKKMVQNDSELRGQWKDKGDLRDWEGQNKQQKKENKDEGRIGEKGKDWEKNPQDQQSARFEGKRLNDKQDITKDVNKNKESYAYDSKSGLNLKKEEPAMHQSAKAEANKMQAEGGQNQMDEAMDTVDTSKVDNSKNDPFKKENYNKEQKNDSSKREEKDKKNEKNNETHRNFQPAH